MDALKRRIEVSFCVRNSSSEFFTEVKRPVQKSKKTTKRLSHGFSKSSQSLKSTESGGSVPFDFIFPVDVDILRPESNICIDILPSSGKEKICGVRYSLFNSAGAFNAGVFTFPVRKELKGSSSL